MIKAWPIIVTMAIAMSSSLLKILKKFFILSLFVIVRNLCKIPA